MLSEDHSNIRKDPARNEEYTNWNNNLQGSNSRVDVAQNQVNYLEHKEEKNNYSEQQEEKIIQKMRIVSAASGTTSRGPIFISQCARRRERARNWKSWNNCERKLP